MKSLEGKVALVTCASKGIGAAIAKALAHHYLRNTNMSGAEISFLLGFEDSNSFARAFQAWTGKTPQAVRNLIE